MYSLSIPTRVRTPVGEPRAYSQVTQPSAQFVMATAEATRMRVPRSALNLTLNLCLAVSASVTPARHESRQETTPQRREGRTLIDGSKTPNQIDDRTAIGLIFMTMAIPEDTPVRQAEGRLTAMIGFRSADAEIMRKELTRFHGLLTELQSDAAVAVTDAQRDRTPENVSRIREVSEQMHTKAEESYERLQIMLSADGAAKLAKFVESQKRNMKVLGPSSGVPPSR